MNKYINQLPDELTDGMKQFLLNNEICYITVVAQKGEKNEINIKNGCLKITYADKVYFFRALSLAKGKADDFFLCENKKIKNSGVQLDLSRNGALTVSAIKRYIDYMAAMGMNKLYLYMEDMFEVADRKYFGYLRGRYSEEELREIDDYGYNYGIEVIPSIQALGHHFQYLKWEEATDVKDTSGELLADNEKTYEFIENMIKSVLKPLRTKKILLGMDETRTLGLGNFLKKSGYENSRDIFLRHLNKVFEITDKLGIEGIIYDDMFFNMASEKSYYYDKDAYITDEIAEKIPENATLVYWHYGEEYGCDELMLEKHKKFNRKPIFFGGSWTWSGHLPETAYALDCTANALKACEKYEIDEAIITVWGDNGNECNHFYSLLTVQYAAEFIYGGEKEFKIRFEDVTGANADAFIDMSAYQNKALEGVEYKWFADRFMGKTFFWQDLLLGQADLYLKDEPMSNYYEKYADKFKVYSKTESVWKKHYEYISLVFEALKLKCYISENIQDAYLSNNFKMLTKLLAVLNELYVILDNCHKQHKELWFETNKPFGWEVIDIRYGGLKARIVTAKERIEKYLKGEIKEIEELKDERLKHIFSPFTPYRNIVTTSYEF